LPNLLTVLGAGGAFVLGGVLLVGAAAGLGLTAAFAIPYWASFLIVGAVFLVGGGMLIGRGAEEAPETVEKEISVSGLTQNFPLFMVGSASALGLLVGFLWRPRRRIQVVREPAEPVVVQVPASGPSYSEPASSYAAPTHAAPAYEPTRDYREPRREPSQPSAFSSLLSSLAPLAVSAATTAAQVGLRALKLPDPEALFKEVFGLDKGPEDSARSAAGDREGAEPAGAGHNGNGRFTV